jgi:type VI secretion system protein ImpG
MSVVEFAIDPEQGLPPEGLSVPRDSVLYSPPIDGVPCKFRTCYETKLWPIRVADARWTTPDRLTPPARMSDAVSALRLELVCTGDAGFDKLGLDSLRFHLSGESTLTHNLYELLLNNTLQILVRDPAPQSKIKALWLGPESLKAVGFGEKDGALPYPRRSFLGYRLLQEYFTFPEKFFFLDLIDLGRLRGGGFRQKIEIVFFIKAFERHDRQQHLEVGVSEKTLRLGCTPIVNVFAQTAEPILLTHNRYEYPIVPDASRRSAMEVFSVDRVVSVDPRDPEPIVFEPFYSYRHALADEKKQTFWHSSRRPSTLPHDDRTEVFITTVDMSGRPLVPATHTLTVRTTCTNGDLPRQLPIGNPRGDLQLEGATPVKRITILMKPTSSVPPPMGKNALWSLISHLSLNYLSLVDEGKEALQNILRLYNFSDTAHTQKQIRGINRIQSRQHFTRVISEHGISFAKGTRIEIELDEDLFVGGGVFLFSSVLENFLGLYASMNSFSELIAKTSQRREVLRHWPPRAGQQVLV